jgi:hypothetical protein
MTEATTRSQTMTGYQAMANAIDLKLFKLDSSR